MASTDFIPKITPLLILGGLSSRMGSPKHLLRFPDGRPAIQHSLEVLQAAVPTASKVCISVRDREQLDVIQDGLEERRLAQGTLHYQDHGHDHVIDVQYVPVFDDQSLGDIGPAAGLLAAHASDPTATVLVMGCDYPHLPASALLQLIVEYRPPVTCFLSKDKESEKEWMEPLVAIWSPEALERLKVEVEKGVTGLNRIVRLLGGLAIWPLREEWLVGCNTPQEWEDALRMLREVRDLS